MSELTLRRLALICILNLDQFEGAPVGESDRRACSYQLKILRPRSEEPGAPLIQAATFNCFSNSSYAEIASAAYISDGPPPI